MTGRWLLVLATACAADPRARFEDEVLPVLAARCADATCHGVAPDAEARGEHLNPEGFYVELDVRGRVAAPGQAYDAAKRFINTVEDPALSTLVRKPLAATAGGLGHYGGGTFGSDDDPGYRALTRWIAAEAGGGEDPLPLTPDERRFADEIQPILVAATCLTARCHGSAAGGVPYHLDDGFRGHLGIAATRHNHRATLQMVSLDGFPEQSRLLRKSRPLGLGIVHKGGSFDFYAGEPGGGTAAIEAWICDQRRARTGRGCAAPGAAPITGFVYVRGPVMPGPTFALDRFAPGSDLFLATVDDATLTPSATANLTAGLHPDGPADIRDPAVSRDGTLVVFAMRTSIDTGHHLWVMDLATRAARQLTFGNHVLPGGGLATDRDPTWGPDGTVWFASTRAGVVADQGQLLDAELYSVGLADGALRRWTFTPHVERKPTFFDVGDEAGGEVGFSALRDGAGGPARGHGFRFPPSQRTEYHQHFGVTPLASLIYDLREFPDGRYAAMVGELSARWRAGALAVIDRNFGPEINPRAASQVPALEDYRPPMTVIARDGGYRDPAPLPDGRMLVAHQPPPFDPDDATAAFTPRLEVLTLTEAADGSGPRLASATVLLAEPGVALTDPEPIAVRAPIATEEPALAADADAPALFRHHGLAMVAALLENLAPSGTKVPLPGIAAVRLVEHLPTTPNARRPVGDDGATTAALGRHGPARILAELPVAADGSFQAEVPPGVSFRVQALDVDGMAIGPMHNRWYYALPGQIVTQGLTAEATLAGYRGRCAPCHGDPTGAVRPIEPEAPDAVTAASWSASRFVDRDPRRPIKPPMLGVATRIEVDFARDLQPILTRRCGACHGPVAPAAGLALTDAGAGPFTMAYAALLVPGVGSGGARAYVDDRDGQARTSYLIELVTGRELAAPRSLARPGVPHPAELGAPPLTDYERRTLIRWIELGATFIGTEAR